MSLSGRRVIYQPDAMSPMIRAALTQCRQRIGKGYFTAVWLSVLMCDIAISP